MNLEPGPCLCCAMRRSRKRLDGIHDKATFDAEQMRAHFRPPLARSTRARPAPGVAPSSEQHRGGQT